MSLEFYYFCDHWYTAYFAKRGKNKLSQAVILPLIDARTNGRNLFLLHQILYESLYSVLL